MEEFKRLSTVAKSFNTPANILSPDETKHLFPLINTDIIKGALHSPYDGTADPSALCTALTTGALAAGAQVKYTFILILIVRSYYDNKYCTTKLQYKTKLCKYIAQTFH